MAVLRTQAIVLRHVAYRDSDRMLTLFSPEHGRIDAKAAGVLKQKSALIASSELFAVGEYMLYQRAGRNTVTGFALEESYYPLRTDYDRLRHAAYLLNLCEAVVMPEQSNKRLFLALRAGLAYLTYSEDIDPEAVTLAFLMSFSRTLGMQPQLSACVHCGSQTSLHWRLEDRTGGIACSNCQSDGEGVDLATLELLRDLQQQGMALLEQWPEVPWTQALRWMRRFVEQRMEKRIVSAKYL